MTKLEDFVNYAKSLSPEDLEVLEKQLSQFMPKPEDNDVGLLPEQLIDLEKRRLQSPRVYASEDDVEALLGRRFN